MDRSGRGLRLLLRLLGVLLRACAHALLRALSPSRCCACDRPRRHDAVFCPPCATSIVACPAPGSVPLAGGVRAVAFGSYGGALADAIRRFKYDDRPELAVLLGALARLAARRARLQPEVVVPVPLHPRRLAERGYNQAALLARLVAGDLGAQLRPRALQRVRETAPQAALARDARLANVRGAFAVRQPRALDGRHVLLVDDVLTTGATLATCARAIREAGARRVDALVIATAVRADEPVTARPG